MIHCRRAGFKQYKTIIIGSLSVLNLQELDSWIAVTDYSNIW
jgi:hypothetical protein